MLEAETAEQESAAATTVRRNRNVRAIAGSGGSTRACG
jgi:hypothetical protein